MTVIISNVTFRAYYFYLFAFQSYINFFYLYCYYLYYLNIFIYNHCMYCPMLFTHVISTHHYIIYHHNVFTPTFHSVFSLKFILIIHSCSLLPFSYSVNMYLCIILCCSFVSTCYIYIVSL